MASCSDRNGVKVTAFAVDHGEAKPAYGYRIDFNGHSVLISGDTRYSENLVKNGTGVDLLIHQVLAVNPLLLEKVPPLRGIFNLHTSPDKAGEVFAKSKPKLAVYSHIVLLGRPGIQCAHSAPSIEDLVRETRTTYSGPLVVGIDLIRFAIGDAVTVEEPPNSTASIGGGK